MKTKDALGRRDRFVAGVLHGGSRNPIAMLVRLLLIPPALLHLAGLEIYLLPFRIGLRTRHRFRYAGGNEVPTIAIGNLTSGGTGKTPMAQLVAGGLHRSGHRVILLSRGHGGSGEADNRPRVVSDGFRTLLPPRKAGDEPVLLADSLPGIPVLTGRDRRRSGDLGVERFATDVVVLDDALQYWQLERDLDIVLLDARRPFDNGFLLPRGLLREPAGHLKRAGIIVLTRADRVSAPELEKTIARCRRLAAPDASIFTATHTPVGWVNADDHAAPLLPPAAMTGRKVALFSGIADNQSFRETVESLGAVIGFTEFRPDHAHYSRDDVAALARGAAGADAMLTTEKDMVKVGPYWPADAVPLLALRIGMSLNDEKAFFEIIDRVISGAD